METKTCRRCRTAQPLDKLVTFNEGKTQRYRCKDDCQRPKKMKPKTYLITSVFNNSRINTNLWVNMHRYVEDLKAKDIDAEILVLPLRYRYNKDSWYDGNVSPYLVFKNLEYNSIKVLGNYIQNSTVVNPLSGLEHIAFGKSTIIGSPQQAMKYVANPESERPLMLASTGSISIPCYEPNKAGIRSQQYHTQGFLVVEIVNDKFYCRPIEAKDEGSFIDLGKLYEDEETLDLIPQAFVAGDTHFGFHCPNNERFIKRLCTNLKPKHLVLHDVFDGHSISHHDEKNPFSKFNKVFPTLGDELIYNAKKLNEYRSLADKMVLVDSNHNDFLYRWVQRTDWKFLDPETAKTYFKLAQYCAQGGDQPYSYVMQSLNVDATFLTRTEDFKLSGYELSFHGDKGSGGARGNIKHFVKTGNKYITGHAHTAILDKRCIQVGTSTTLGLSYTKGSLNNWTNSHAIVYNGHNAQLITVWDENVTFNSEFYFDSNRQT